MAFAGWEGSVSATGMQADVTGFAIDENALALETSVLGTQGRTFITGPTDWNGTMNMLFSASNTLGVGATFNGTWTLSTGNTKAGRAIITQIGNAVEFEGVVVAPITFQGDGVLT